MNALSAEPVMSALLSDPVLAARWVAWQTELPNGRDKPTKVPHDPGRRGPAKSNDASTWGTRPAAETRAGALPKPYDVGGIGLVLGDLGNGRILAGVDLDTCKDDAGTPAP